MALNVLTMDGGGSLSLYSLYALQYIEQQHPGFLATIDVFGGTSAGGINALLMAAAASPEVGLQRGIQLWEENPFDTSIVRMVRAGLGCISVYSNQGFVDALRPVFLDMTLGDLADRKRYVIIPSFQLKGKVAEVGVTDGVVTEDLVTSWTPVVYHNLGGSLDLNLSLLDVALRTSAAPVFLPIYQGHVDGGLFANNPAMAALARLLAHPLRGDGRAARAGEIRLLSVGTGQKSSYLDVENADWGWQQWLFDPRRPLALVEAFFNAGSLEIDAQCRTILGAENFYRLNPPHKIDGQFRDFDLEDEHLPDGHPDHERLKVLLRESVEQSPEINRNAAAKRAKLLGSKKPATPDVLSWLDKAGWHGGKDDEGGAAAPGGGTPPAKKATPKKGAAPKRRGA